MDTLRALGAELVLVPAAPYSNPNHFVHTSRRIAEETPGALWADQFDNTANRFAHIRTTAAEIWAQTGGKLHGFTCAVGTGGTLAGTGLGLKEHSPDITIALTDPYGAALYNYYAHGELRAEGSSVAEGIGQGRITANLEGAPVDAQFRIRSEEHTSELKSLMRNSYAVFCLEKKIHKLQNHQNYAYKNTNKITTKSRIQHKKNRHKINIDKNSTHSQSSHNYSNQPTPHT